MRPAPSAAECGVVRPAPSAAECGVVRPAPSAEEVGVMRPAPSAEEGGVMRPAPSAEEGGVMRPAPSAEEGGVMRPRQRGGGRGHETRAQRGGGRGHETRASAEEGGVMRPAPARRRARSGDLATARSRPLRISGSYFRLIPCCRICSPLSFDQRSRGRRRRPDDSTVGPMGTKWPRRTPEKRNRLEKPTIRESGSWRATVARGTTMNSWRRLRRGSF